MGTPEGKGGSWKTWEAEDAAHSYRGEQSWLGAPYLPGLAVVQKHSVIDGRRSAQGRCVAKFCRFMSETCEIFNRVASGGQLNAGVVTLWSMSFGLGYGE